MNSTKVREHLIQQTAALLLGPMLEDERLNSSPSDTYLTGILWPSGTTMDAADDDAATMETDADDETADEPVPGYRTIRPCSIGLTCTVAAHARLVVELGKTARYLPQATASSDGMAEAASNAGDQDDETVDRVPEWHRQPLEYRFTINPDERRSQWRQTRFQRSDGRWHEDRQVAVDIRRRSHGELVVLTATLINLTPEPGRDDHQRDSALLFQSGLQITAVDDAGNGAIHPRTSAPLVEEEDAQINQLLYRNVHEFAVGHGIGAEWDTAVDQRVGRVETSWMPRAVVIGTSPRGDASLAALNKGTANPFAADWLGQEPARISVCAALTAFCDIYGRWIDTALAAHLDDFNNPIHRQAAAANLARCRATLARMRRGVATLEQSDPTWTAFALANQAMDTQSRFRSRGDQAGPLVWRPFQLAFVLLVLPTLVNGRDPDRRTMDLLWFPTGGGKTEAYLALTAFQIFLQRLQHAQRRRQGGVDVLMRYTLRLLTIQQFQRAAALICACDALRKTNPKRLGTAPITLGLYVGDKSTPNRLNAAESRLAEEHQGEQPASTPRQLLKCPVCGAKLPPSAYSLSAAKDRVETRCPAQDCATAGQPLPVMTVDEELYQHPPSLLIGTIDKFAQLPRRTDLRALFGLDSGQRPSLIIQDELHLISGPLGSMSGLYEAAIDQLCTLENIPAKIIGSTATIGRANHQVRALFDRDVLQFPPPGFDAEDAFFAVRDTTGPDRTYLGISTAGRSPKFALQAVMAALLQSADALRQSGTVDDSALDAYWTCVGYFNSLRELGGAHVLMQDDVPRQMGFLARRLGQTGARITAPPEELSSRVASREIPQALARLDQMLDARDPFAAEPVDSVLASNMISVGVDIPRLGLMVVNGQPKSTAEYIQATSRVGRRKPGLVITLYNFSRPRDLSHFEHFAAYHGALYRGVEATSVTPWAPRARDKALHAVLIATVRHLIDDLIDDEAAVRFTMPQPQLDAIVDALVARAHAASQGLEHRETEQDLHHVIQTWLHRAQENRTAGARLRYWEKKAPFGRTAPHLMRASEELRDPGNPAWPTPNSMRDVEPSTAFVLKRLPSATGGHHGG